MGINSVRRIISDVNESHKEYDIEVNRLEKMQNDEKFKNDAFRLNQQSIVIAEASRSIGDYKNLLKKAIEQL